MGRKQTKKTEGSAPEFVDVNFTVPYGLLSRFDQECEKRGYTRSEALRETMRRQLEIWTGMRF